MIVLRRIKLFNNLIRLLYHLVGDNIKKTEKNKEQNGHLRKHTPAATTNNMQSSNQVSLIFLPIFF